MRITLTFTEEEYQELVDFMSEIGLPDAKNFLLTELNHSRNNQMIDHDQLNEEAYYAERKAYYNKLYQEKLRQSREHHK